MEALGRRVNVWGVALIALVLAAWQIQSWRIESVGFPGPYQVLMAGIANRDLILAELGHTYRRAVTAFAIALAISLPLGIILGRFRLLGRIADPIIGFFDAIPGIAIIPLVMLFFGTGDGAKIAIIVYAISPNILIHAIEGVRQAPPMLNRVARSLRLSNQEIMRLVDLPAAMPLVVTGLRLAIAGSLLVSITSELLLATDGIGTYLQRKQESFQIAAGLAGVFVISLTGLAINLGVRRLEKRLLFWHFRDHSG